MRNLTCVELSYYNVYCDLDNAARYQAVHGADPERIASAIALLESFEAVLPPAVLALIQEGE